ncbi:hypothetical protein HU200_057892 [Digitaria exilis]|uniref:Uncharacterized protein n=1 Tax=Digitaria exilis TaxID=1010633 RepID=A0A835AJ59_9POAL|nr:hypothetical protein HU200_057892 [Digitaria exilis]
MGPSAAGKPYSSSARRSSSRNAGWPRCATRTTNLREPSPDSTRTATCPAGTTAPLPELEEEEVASAAAPPRERQRRRTRRRQTSDGIVIATLHMLDACVCFARRSNWSEQTISGGLLLGIWFVGVGGGRDGGGHL